MNFLSNLVNRIGRNNLIIVAAIVVLLVALYFLLSGKGVNIFAPKPTTTAVPTAKPTPTTVPGDTIMITFTRPVPKVLTLKKGRYVNFANFSGARVDIQGADSFSKDLNIGVLNDNDTSDLILLKQTGTYKYYDKLNPKITGEIIITN